MNFFSFVRKIESQMKGGMVMRKKFLSYCSIVKVTHANSLKAELECDRREATMKPADC